MFRRRHERLRRQARPQGRPRSHPQTLGSPRDQSGAINTPFMLRRRFLQTSGLLTAGSLLGRPLLSHAADAAGPRVTLPFANGARELATFPQKRPLILLTSRPPQLETPFAVFNEGVITPNDAFFVRYHLAAIPQEIDIA